MSTFTISLKRRVARAAGRGTACSAGIARRGPAIVAVLTLLGGCRDERLATAPLAGRGADSVGLRPGGPSLTITGANVTDIGSLGGGTTSALSINSVGQVAGESFTGTGAEHAFLWTPSTGMQDLGTLGGSISGATASNSLGQVAGWSKTSGDATQHAFVWTSGTGMRDLGTLGGSFSQANAINNVGQLAGVSYTSTGEEHAFVWTLGPGMQDLGTLGGSFSFATGINSIGQVVGFSTTAGDAAQHAFLWTPGAGMQDLGTLGGSFSQATAINDAGQVVGASYTSTGAEHAFLRMPGAGMQDLGTLGGSFSVASGINTVGQVAGASYTSAGAEHAFLWSQSDGMEDLWPSIALAYAVGPNDNMQVLEGRLLVTLTYVANQPPSAEALTINITAGTPAAVLLAGVDPEGGALNYTVTVSPQHGMLSGTAPNVTYTPVADYVGADAFTYTVTDPKGLASQPATVSITVAPPNHPPTVSAGGPYMANEASPLPLAWSATDPDADALTYSWDFGDGSTGAGSTLPLNHAYADNGTYTISITANDGRGGTDTKTAAATITNVPPTAAFPAPASVPEGSPVTLSLINGVDVSSADLAAGLHYAFDCGSGYGTASSYATAGTSSTSNCPTTDNGSVTVRGKVFDKDNGASEYLSSATITNVSPSVGALTVPAAPVAVGTLVSVSAPFTDPGILDTHTGAVQWALGASFGTASIAETNGSGTVNAASSTLGAGVYTITLEVTDKDGGVGQSTAPTYVVVYDPDGSFVTGGGWIESPLGAYTANPTLVGKASFGFVSKYQKGQTTPSGNTQFQFKAGNLSFVSASYDWLVVAGARAQFKGEGTINGGGSYGFLLTAIDGDVTGGGGVDRFRIKIWDSATGGVVYDNQLGAADDTTDPPAALSGGSIQIHQ